MTFLKEIKKELREGTRKLNKNICQYPIIILIGRFCPIFGKVAKFRSSHSADYANLNRQKICPITTKWWRSGSGAGGRWQRPPAGIMGYLAQEASNTAHKS